MKTALLALAIFVGVGVVVGLQAWRMNRRIAPTLDDEARKALEAREHPETVVYPPPSSRMPRRIVLVIYVFPGILFLGGSAVGIALDAGGVVLAFALAYLAVVFTRPFLVRRYKEWLAEEEDGF